MHLVVGGAGAHAMYKHVHGLVLSQELHGAGRGKTQAHVCDAFSEGKFTTLNENRLNRSRRGIDLDTRANACLINRKLVTLPI